MTWRFGGVHKEHVSLGRPGHRQIDGHCHLFPSAEEIGDFIHRYLAGSRDFIHRYLAGRNSLIQSTLPRR